MSPTQRNSGLLFPVATTKTAANTDAVKDRKPAAPKPVKLNKQQQRQSILYALDGLEQARGELEYTTANCISVPLLAAVNAKIAELQAELKKL
jgi:hypothetical protein